MTKEEARRLVETYGRAWETKDPDLLTSLFINDATYEDPHEPIQKGKKAIRTYWVDKVVNGQEDVHFHLKNLWVENETIIAEWDAVFIDTKRRLMIQMTEVAILGVEGGKISSLREYYKTKKTSL